jgi:putative flavoprotein involved in K+ transport
VFATGYRPHLGYLRPLGALDHDGMPLHSGGISATHPGLVYVGLEFQRSFPPTLCAACTATPST